MSRFLPRTVRGSDATRVPTGKLRHSFLLACSLVGLMPFSPVLAQTGAANGGCAWVEDTRNFAFPETHARYYRALLPGTRNANTVIRIRGNFLDVRYSSLQLYGTGLSAIDTLPDYLIVPAPGGISNVRTKTWTDPSIVPSGGYEARVLFVNEPTTPAANTLYTGANRSGQITLTLRTYVENGVPRLPELSTIENGVERPFANTSTSTQCRNQNLMIKAGTAVLDAGGGNGGTSVLPPMNNRDRPLEVYYGAPLQPGGNQNSGTGVNQDARFMSASVTKSNHFVIVRGRAPTSSASRPSSNPDVRYWSICSNRQLLQGVVACGADSEVPIDRDGFFNILISDLSRKPKFDLLAAGYGYLPFGSSSPGFIIYRQLLIEDSFVGSVNRVPKGTDPSAVIGDYAPVARYCNPQTFNSSVSAGLTPAQIFSRCLAQ